MLLPKQAVLVGSPLTGKCLSTEQVVASMLPDNAAAQTPVLEAPCEEGIKSKILRRQGDLGAELCPLSSPWAASRPSQPGSSDLLSSGLRSASKHRLIEQMGRSWTAESGDLSLSTSPNTC